MKLPFVSREALDLAVAEAAYFRVQAEKWEARYLDLAVPKPVLPVVKEVDPVSRAIRDAAGSNSALRTHLSHFARTERERGVKDEKIIADIRAYEQPPLPQSTKPEREDANAALAEILDGL